MEYIGYHKWGEGPALLVLRESVGDWRAIIAPIPGVKGKRPTQIGVYRMKATEFDSTYVRNGQYNPKPGADAYGAKYAAEKLMLLKLPVTKQALEHIEGALMDTRGKTTVEIRAEVARLAVELPKGHELANVPKVYPDRGSAIAALTAMRQTLYHLKEKAMTDAATAAPTKATTKNSTTVEAKKPSKAKVTKPTAATAEPLAKKGKAAAKPAAKANGEAKKPRGKPRTELVGPFKLAGDAAKVKDVSELRVHEGSARASLMAYAIKNAAKKSKGFTAEELIAAVGDQGAQALQNCVGRGYLVAV